MRVMQRTATLASGGQVANIWSGSAFEFLPGNAIVSMGINATAGTLGTINAGGTSVLEESVMATGTDFPTIPDDMFYTFAGVQGDRLVTSIRNPTGGTITYFALAQIQEV
jgi:hypothetical protein